jgi:hypothetical protein
MGARGIYTAQEEHVVQMIKPASYSSTTTSAVIDLKNWEHCTLIYQQGVAGTPPTITINAANAESPTSVEAIGFNLHTGENGYGNANADVLSGRTAVASTGYQPAATAGIVEVLEIDADTLPEGYDFLELVATSPTGCYFGVVAILSGGRYVHDQSETVLA